jgi:hypothetical protein
MDKRKGKTRFTIIRTISDVPMSESEYRQGEAILAKWIARAYVADHPELFGPGCREVVEDLEGKE